MSNTVLHLYLLFQKIIWVGLLLGMPFTLLSQHTFSIVAADPATGEIGSAGATCVPGIGRDGGVVLINSIVPGRGGVNAQASVCISPHINLRNAIARMEEGLSPQAILDWLKANDACFAQGFDPESRQYGIVDFDPSGNPRAAAFTGSNAFDYKGQIVGPSYAIQGNILAGPQVLEDMEQAFLSTEGNLAEKLMAAMQAAKRPGADSRCFPAGTSSTSAYLRVFRPDDPPSNPFLELLVNEAPFGSEPIDDLQDLYDSWKLTGTVGGVGQGQSNILLVPNPARDQMEVQFQGATPPNLLMVFDSLGKELARLPVQRQDKIILPIGQFPPGVYMLSVVYPDSTSETLRFRKQ